MTLRWQFLQSLYWDADVEPGFTVLRSQISGGWLVTVRPDRKSESQGGHGPVVPYSVAFVPDPEHLWEGGSPEEWTGEKYFTTEDAAVFLGVERERVQLLVELKELKPVNRGGRRVFRQTDLEAADPLLSLGDAVRMLGGARNSSTYRKKVETLARMEHLETKIRDTLVMYRKSNVELMREKYDGYLTVQEALGFLGVDEHDMDELVRQSLMPHIGNPNRLIYCFFHKKILEAFKRDPLVSIKDAAVILDVSTWDIEELVKTEGVRHYGDPMHPFFRKSELIAHKTEKLKNKPAG